MKRIAALLALVISTTSGFAQIPTASVEKKVSPAEQRMAQAKKLIEKNPNDFEAYNTLALALSRRARETSDIVYYTQGDEALQKSFAIEFGSGCCWGDTSSQLP